MSQILFIILFCIAGFFIYKSIKRIRRNIMLGKPLDRSDNPGQRLKVMALVALGQKKMFHKPIPAVLHMIIYVGFILVNVEIVEILLDGITGQHRLFAPILGSVYPFLINVFEFFAVGVIVTCVIFLIRRNFLKVRRLAYGEEMKAWPKLDANLILMAEILLMIAFLSMNATDNILQQRGYGHYTFTGNFFFSGFLNTFFINLTNSQLAFIERFGWWFHIIGVMGFANYVFYNSKHLHIFMAFPNTYFSKLDSVGKWPNMPAVTNEVNMMLNLPVSPETFPAAEAGRFGAKDVNDLTWKNLMDAYSCTECGRCTAACPANITGKRLSPRKIMMDTRDRIEEVGRNLDQKGKDFTDNKSLLHDYITTEEIMACTTCNACVQACPITIDPLNIIMQLRQYQVMEESKAPASWNGMFSSIENNFAPWKFSPADRFNWAENINSKSENN